MSYITLAIISALFVWVSEFLTEVAAKEKIVKLRFLFYSAFIQIFLSFAYFIYNWETFYITLTLWFLTVLRVILLIEKTSNKIESLKYIDTSLFFPVNNIIKVFWWITFWMILFWEFLNMYEIISIIIWIVAVLLMWYKKSKNENKDFKKGIFYLVLSSLALVWTSTINKYMWENESVWLYLFISNIFWSLYIFSRLKLSKTELVFIKKEILFWSIFGIFAFSWFLLLLLSLKEWKLAVVQIISSIAIFIPILLSMIFYKEKISRVRFIWLILFMISLGIFYIK